MKRVWTISLGACAALLLVNVAVAGPGDTFTLGFGGPDSLSGPAGGVVSASYNCMLTHDAPGDEAGAQGWSISLTADNATITGVGIAGTDAEALFAGGFEKSETTSSDSASTGDCEGRAGAVSAVVLSFTMPIVLPINASSALATIDVEATIPEEGGTATLRYVNSCKGSGQPVSNNITQEGATRQPALEEMTVDLVVVVCACNDTLGLGFSSERIESFEAWSGVAGVDSSIADCAEGNADLEKCSADGGIVTISGSPGDTVAGDVYANIIQQVGDSDKVQGWSMSIAFSSDTLTLVNATTEGTSGAPTPDGLQNGGFEKTEVVDPNLNGQGQGAVTAVVLSFTMPITLEDGTTSVLKLTSEGVVPDADDPGTGGGASTGAFGFSDGLQGAGQPVNNVLTVGGGSANAGNIGTASVGVVLEAIPAFPFIRGNANNDLKVDLADAIWTINELFRGGPASVCQDAADANDDGMVDLSDATYGIEYLFLAGPTPPEPFGVCAPDPSDLESPEGDGLGCSPEANCF